MAFQDSDDGPFWMTPIEREQRRFDIILPETKMRRFTREGSESKRETF